MALTRHERHVLEEHGFYLGSHDTKGDHRAVVTFQRAWACGPLLKVDGVLGPKTREAMATLPHLAPHFTVAEVWDWRERECLIRRELLLALEALRAAAQRPLRILSGYRSLATNTVVGGADNSLHMHGVAADLNGTLPLRFVQGLQVFSGIGCTKDGKVAHVDLRHTVSGFGGTPQRPTRWTYG